MLITCYQLSFQALGEGKVVVSMLKGMRQAMAGGTRMKALNLRENINTATATEIKLPCLMAICGSVCTIIKVKRNFFVGPRNILGDRSLVPSHSDFG